MTKENVTMPTPQELAEFCAKCADDKLAENVKVISVGAVSSIADYYVIATANSEPQLHALCSELERRVRDEYKLHPTRTDGVGTGGWNLIDFSSVLVHLMTPEMRERYNLEGLWGDAPTIDVVTKLDNVSQKDQ
ncbi:MAG: ribosome silencing factor [Lentisphaeria bacterium]|nr:ribosome silencing factor [Lentisphaeria bacterium]